MLNTVEWDYFKLKDLFDIKRGMSLPIKKQENGKIPLVSSTSLNNGVTQYVKLSKQNTLYKAKSITLAINGNVGETFYQPEDFYATGDVAVLSSKFLDDYIGLFLSTLLRLEKKRYSYGRKWSINKIRETKIKLPVDVEGKPNWDFMREYIKNLSSDNLENFDKPKTLKKLKFDNKEWGNFKIKDIFTVKKLPDTTSSLAESFISNISNNDIAYVTRTVKNNGIRFFCNKDLILIKDVEISKGNKIIIGGEASESFFIESDFITGNNITILENTRLNRYTGLFVISIIDTEFYRYSYGRSYIMSRVKETKIKLPVDKEGNPDWQFMEDYIKSLPYTKYL